MDNPIFLFPRLFDGTVLKSVPGENEEINNLDIKEVQKINFS